MSKSVLFLLSAAGLIVLGAGAFHFLRPAKRAPRPQTHAMAVVAQNARESEDRAGIEQARMEDKAYPADSVPFSIRQNVALAFDSVAKRPGGKKGNWQALGPSTPAVPGEVTYTGVANVVSGRITALAMSPVCGRNGGNDCRLVVGAAGGGVWLSENPLEGKVKWKWSSTGIPTNAIGSLAFDPNDRIGKTIYAGTGEGNQSADSEAGIGLFRSTDGGKSWSAVPGSAAVSNDRAIAAVRVDPANAGHILIGTNTAIQGGSSVGGGAVLPTTVPPPPAVGLYESTDGGLTFALALAHPTAEIAFDPSDAGTVYATSFDGGVWRRSPRLDGDTAFHLVLAPRYGAGERSSIALTTTAGHTRAYAARGSISINAADLLRADNADVPAAALLASGWLELSNPVRGTPGFASNAFCGNSQIGTQCWYDMYVASPPGKPDEVWIGGAMQYSEIFTANPPSNGRAVQRSTDAGASFTDMTNDAQNLGMHPDQHAIAFAGDLAFVGSDGGLMRTSGAYLDASSQCDSRGLSPTNLAQCKQWLSAIPTRLTSLNDGLATLQFQSVSINQHDPLRDILGGTQDNGTWAFNGSKAFETVGGDGGQTGTDVFHANIRMHTYTGGQGDVNFNGTDPLGWDWWGDALLITRETFSFYMPLINDPVVSGTWFAAGQHVFRTKDNGGPQDFMDSNCNEFFGSFEQICGDWEALGPAQLTSTFYGADKFTPTANYVVAVARASSNSDTLWAATRRGRVFVSTNGSATPASSVVFTRIDTSLQPNRFVSGIVVDPADANHAYVSFGGYQALTPTQPGHVFDVHYNPGTLAATWVDLSANLGDQPVTDVALDDLTGSLYASLDYGVVVLRRGSASWTPAAGSLPAVAVYGLTIDSRARVLYAATHGRGAFKLDLSLPDNDLVASR
jgi:hypothetical protein